MSSGVTRAMTPISSICAEQLVVAHGGELGAGDGAAGDAEVLRDRCGGDRVVAGDHAHLDPGGVRDRDRVLRRRPRRVDDAHERERRQPVQQREEVGVRVERRRVEVLPPCREDAETLLAEPLVLGLVALLEPGVDLDQVEVVRRERLRRAGEQLVGRALDEAADDVAARLVLHPVEGRHQLVRGVERQLRDPRIRLARRDRGEPALLAEHDEGALGRVPDQLAVVDDRVAGEHQRLHELLEVDVRLSRDLLDHALGRVAVAVDRVAAARDRQLHRGHLVERQRPGLVGVDGRRRAERLGRAQPLHDGVRLRERLRAHREDRGHHGGQAGRDRRDGECDRGEEDRVLKLSPRDMLSDDRDDERGAGDDEDLARQLVQLLRQRRGRLVLLGQHVRDVADLGRHPGRGDDRARRRPSSRWCSCRPCRSGRRAARRSA